MFKRNPKRNATNLENNRAYEIHLINSKYYKYQLFQVIREYQKENNIKADGIYESSSQETMAAYILDNNIPLKK